MRSHWAVRNLSGLLSSAGFHVMRFDYFGTGDSAGDSMDASLGRWRSDIHTAVGELRDTSGVTKVSLVGLRLGGALALQACGDGLEIEDAVLWDPVVDGRRHIEELERMHRELYKIFPTSRDHFSCPTLQELLGAPISDRMRREVESLDLRTCSPRMGGRIIVIASEENGEYASFTKHLEATSLNHVYVDLPDACDWGNIGDFYHRMSPTNIPKAIVELLARKEK
jgi:pimeloyl-ACP methyl ester carboxylesterase